MAHHHLDLGYSDTVSEQCFPVTLHDTAHCRVAVLLPGNDRYMTEEIGNDIERQVFTTDCQL